MLYRPLSNYRCILIDEWKEHSCHSSTSVPITDSLLCLEKLVYSPGTYPSLDPSLTFSCRKCQITFSDPFEYQKHRRTHDKYLCDQCDFSCQRQSHLLSHLMLSHQTEFGEMDKLSHSSSATSRKSEMSLPFNSQQIGDWRHFSSNSLASP